MRRLILGLAAAAVCLAGGAALAHRGTSSLSVVVIDPASGEMTVTHRMAAHDVEPALAVIAPEEQPSLDNAPAMDDFIAHVQRRFTVDGQTLTYQWHEAEGDDLTLVFKGRVKTPVTSVVVEADLLPPIEGGEPEFQVNVRVGKVTRTLLFTPGAGPQTARFDGP